MNTIVKHRRTLLAGVAGMSALTLMLAACSGSTEPPSGSASASAPPIDLAGEVAAEESALIAAYDSVYPEIRAYAKHLVKINVHELGTGTGALGV